MVSPNGSSGTLPLTIVGDRHGLGIIVVYTFKETPFLVLLVLASWDQHTRDLQEAAAALGADPLRPFRDIVLARVAGAVGRGALVVAAFTLGATEVPLLVGPTRPDTIATYAARRQCGPTGPRHEPTPRRRCRWSLR